MAVATGRPHFGVGGIQYPLVHPITCSRFPIRYVDRVAFVVVFSHGPPSIPTGPSGSAGPEESSAHRTNTESPSSPQPRGRRISGLFRCSTAVDQLAESVCRSFGVAFRVGRLGHGRGGTHPSRGRRRCTRVLRGQQRSMEDGQRFTPCTRANTGVAARLFWRVIRIGAVESVAVIPAAHW